MSKTTNADFRLRYSSFKSSAGLRKIRSWAKSISDRSGNNYVETDVHTDFGTTHIYDTAREDLPALLFLHGWYCNAMLWDVGDDLKLLSEKFRLVLVDVIGQPGLSSAASPPVKGPAYGHWLVQVLDAIGLKTVSLVGMSFGGFLSVKLAQIAAGRIKRMVLLGPAGFVPLSKNPDLLLPVLRPVVRPSRANIRKFTKKILFTGTHMLSDQSYDKILDLFELGFRYFKPAAQPPYVFKKGELSDLRMPVLLLVGSEDALFRAGPMVKRAKRELGDSLEVDILEGHGHAISNSILVIEKISIFLGAAFIE